MVVGKTERMQKISTDIIMIILALLGCWISVAFFSILTFFHSFVTGFALYELLFFQAEKIHLESLTYILFHVSGHCVS